MRQQQDMTRWKPTSLDDPIQIDQSIWNKKDLKGVKIGIPKEYFVDGIDSGVRNEIEAAIERLCHLVLKS